MIELLHWAVGGRNIFLKTDGAHAVKYTHLGPHFCPHQSAAGFKNEGRSEKGKFAPPYTHFLL